MGKAALCGIVILCLFITGCANKGYVEFQKYSVAFDLQYQQADKILDRLAVAERQTYNVRNGRDVLQFNPRQAAYYIDTVEPPITASLRKSLVSIQAYNAVLMSLANGEAADAYASKASAAISDTTAAIAASRVAFGGASETQDAARLVSKVGTELAAALPGLQAASRLRGQQAFRALLGDTHSQIQQALAILIDGTPSFYQILAFSRADLSKRGDPYTTESLKQLEGDHAEMAGWVLMLEATRTALNDAAVAAASRTQVNIGTLASSAADMKVLAEQLKAARLARGVKQ